MGCICSKASPVEDSRESPGRRLSASKQYSELKTSRVNSSKREEGAFTKERLDRRDVKVMLIDKKTNGSMRPCDDQNERKKTEMAEATVLNHPGLGKIPKATEGEQIAAGWPDWLSASAAEAIKGWIPRRADTFEKLDKIGQGTYSNVYKARDVTNNRFVALKKVRFDSLDHDSVKFMAREILILRRLDHPNVIKLEGLITSRTSYSLYLVFEYMEHDLTGLASRPGVKFSEPQVKCYMQQLLSGLDHCHSHGVLHRDIKGSNLLIDNHGILKIADFGLASFYDPHHSVPLTSRVVTLWYRPPELILGSSQYGVAVDLWSTGCILGELYAGRPILPGKTEVEQLHKIFKLCGSPSEDYWSRLHLRHATVMRPPHPYRRCIAETFKDVPGAAMRLMEVLLSVEPAARGTADFALKSEFFTTKPLACDPSSLPKYPPSKEIDAKLREEEAMRQGTLGRKSQKGDQERRGHKESHVVPSAYARGKRQDQSNVKSLSEIFNSRREDVASGFMIDQTKHSQAAKDARKDFSETVNKRSSLSGPLGHGPGGTKAGREHNDSLMVSTSANLSRLSGLVAARTTSCEDQHDRSGPLRSETLDHGGRFARSVCEGESTRKQDRKLYTQRNTSSRPVEDERACTKEHSLHGHGSSGNKIYVSGPLFSSSNKVEQMLKEHDRRIQEYARRTRVDKARPEKQVTAHRTSASRNAGG